MKLKKLFKYVVPERIDVLETLKIRFTQPKYLNDPFDAIIRFKKFIDKNVIPQNFDIKKSTDEFLLELDKEMEKQSRLQLNNDSLSLENIFKRRGGSLEDVRKILYPAMEGMLQLFTTDDEKILKEIRNEFNDGINNFIGVLSLTELPDNIAMWAHYASVHTGFIIILNAEDDFFTGGSDNYNYEGLLKKVKYNAEKIIINNLSDAKGDLFYRKHSNWKYEKEWRMVLPLSFASITKYPDICLFDIPSTAIVGIICGYRCDEKLIQYMISLKKKIKHLNHLEIYKAIPNLDEYKMEIEING